ncbi:MAG TPA: MMPL family transporter, partial [Conexibacter sp.]|nr:MMPL family transporter [Conexibacter sp.]
MSDRGPLRSVVRGRGVLIRLADVVVAHPRRILVIWAVLVGLLALAGIGLEQRLSTPAIYVNGTLSKHEHDLVVREFGDEDALVVMVRGPRAAVEQQGRRLAAALAAVPRTRVVSPWSADSAIGGLRPSPNAAAIVVDVGRKPGQLYTDILPPVKQTVERVVRAPARADLSGSPMIAQAMHDAAFDAAAAGERIAMPILMLVLLLVFRSLLAAAVPAMIGGSIVLASRGVISLLVGTVQFDSLAAGLAAMMGLGLGVDYSLLVVSRFREELRRSDDVAAAVRATVTTTGHAVTLAGCALLLTMLVAAQLLPGAIIVSAACSIITASLLSVLSAIFVVPAILMVLGTNLDRWALRSAIDGEPLASRWSRRLTRTPEIALNAILMLLLVGTAVAFTLRTGASSVGLLPPHD